MAPFLKSLVISTRSKMDNTRGSKVNPIVIDSSEEEDTGDTEEVEVAAEADVTVKCNSNDPRDRHSFKRPKLNDSNSSFQCMKSPFRLFSTIQDEEIHKNGSKFTGKGKENSSAPMTLSQSEDRSHRLPVFEGRASENDKEQQSLTNRLPNSHLEYCLTLRQFVGIDADSTNPSAKGPIEWIVIVNFIIDFDFLLDEIPEIVSIPKVIFFFQVGDPMQYKNTLPNAEFYRLDPSKHPSSDTNPLRHKFPFGTHRKLLILLSSKLVLILYSKTMLKIQIPKCFWLDFKGFSGLSSIPLIYCTMMFISKSREHICKTFH
jgi:hypothetical protein